MKIAVNNSQVQLQVQAEKIRKLAVFFMQKTAELTPHVKWSDISILLADNNLIAEINSSYLGKKRPTDVISFALEPMPARAQGGEAMNAEIIVNAERAMETGPKFNGIVRELALYIAHGCDHLSGADDGTPADRKKMRARELQWIKEAESKGLLKELVKTFKPSTKTNQTEKTRQH